MPSVPVIRRAKRKGDPDIYYVPPLDRQPPRPRRPSQTPTGFGGGILPEGDFKRLAAQDRDHPIIARARRYARYLQHPHFYYDRQGRRHSIKQPPREAATHAATNPVQDRHKPSHKEKFSASLNQSSSHSWSIAQLKSANHDKPHFLNGVSPSNTTPRTNPPCDMSLSIRHAAATSIPHRGPPSGKTALADEAAKRASVKAVRGVVLPRHVRYWSLYDLRMHWHELDVDLRRQIDLSVKDREVAWPPHTRASDDEIKAARRLRDASAIYPYAFKKDSERSRGGPFPEYCHLWPELAEKKSTSTAGERSSQAQVSAGTSLDAQSPRLSHGAPGFTAANGPKRSKDATKHHPRGVVGSTISVGTNQAAGQAAPTHAMSHGLHSSAGDASTSPDESRSDLLRTRTAEANRHVVSSIERDAQPSSSQSQVSPRKGKRKVHDTSAHIYVAVPAPSQRHKSPRKDKSKAHDATANERDEVTSPRSPHKNKGNACGITSNKSDELPASPQKPKSPRRSKNKSRTVMKESSPLQEPTTDPIEMRIVSQVQLDEASSSSRTPMSPRENRDEAQTPAEMSLPSPAASASKPGRPWYALPPREGSGRINERDLVDHRTSALSDRDHALLQSRRCQTVPPPTNKVVWFQRVTAMNSRSLALKSRTVGPVDSTVVAATNAQPSTVVQEQDTQMAVTELAKNAEQTGQTEEERAKLSKKYEKLQSKVRKLSGRTYPTSKEEKKQRKEKLSAYKQRLKDLRETLDLSSEDDSSSESELSSESDTSSDESKSESESESDDGPAHLDDGRAGTSQVQTSQQVRTGSHSRLPSASLDPPARLQLIPDVAEPDCPAVDVIHEAEADVVPAVSKKKGKKRKKGGHEETTASKKKRTREPSAPDVDSSTSEAQSTSEMPGSAHLTVVVDDATRHQSSNDTQTEPGSTGYHASATRLSLAELEVQRGELEMRIREARRAASWTLPSSASTSNRNMISETSSPGSDPSNNQSEATSTTHTALQPNSARCRSVIDIRPQHVPTSADQRETPQRHASHALNNETNRSPPPRQPGLSRSDDKVEQSRGPQQGTHPQISAQSQGGTCRPPGRQVNDGRANSQQIAGHRQSGYGRPSQSHHRPTNTGQQHQTNPQRNSNMHQQPQSNKNRRRPPWHRTKQQSRSNQHTRTSEGRPPANAKGPEDPALQLLGQFLPAGASARQRAEAAARLYQSLASQLPE